MAVMGCSKSVFPGIKASNPPLSEGPSPLLSPPVIGYQVPQRSEAEKGGLGLDWDTWFKTPDGEMFWG